jgi:hypothetical protein
MMVGLLRRADDILRGNPLPGGTRSGVPVGDEENTTSEEGATLRRLASVLLAFGLFYGAVMGTFGGLIGERLLQVLFSAIKVPLLLVATFALSLPSFFVLNTLLGVRDDFKEALRAITATQAALTVVLASLAPCTLLWYASSADYQSAILFNALMFGIASLSSQWHLRRLYTPLIARDARHRLLLRVWLILFAFVGIQMGWLLRPFIGNPTEPVRFLREDAWGNAYLAVLQMITNTLRP